MASTALRSAGCRPRVAASRRRSAAAHPSVRSTASASSSVDSGAPKTSAKSSADLPGEKAEVVEADLEHVVGHPPRRQVEVGRLPRGRHHRRRHRQPVDQLEEGVLAGRTPDGVQVVEQEERSLGRPFRPGSTQPRSPPRRDRPWPRSHPATGPVPPVGDTPRPARGAGRSCRVPAGASRRVRRTSEAPSSNRCSRGLRSHRPGDARRPTRVLSRPTLNFSTPRPDL